MKENILQKNVNYSFTKHFGRTPLNLRLEDIKRECEELVRFTDLRNLEEEAGDLLASVIQLCNECGWDYRKLVGKTLAKIDFRAQQYATLGRKIKVAILGGAFDPVHNGHIAVAKFVLDTSRTFDEVWLMPCFKHMNGKKMESPRDRLTMCQLASQADGRIKTFPYEIENEFSGETFHLVTKLLEEDFAKNEYDFSIIIGQDNANTFDTWVNFEHLERMMRFVVVPRKGIKTEGSEWYLKPPHIYLNHENELPNMSSTHIRDMYKNHRDLFGMNIMVHPMVNDYILDKKLYL